MIVSFCATWTTIVSVLTSKNILPIMKQFTSVNWITPRIWHMTVTWLLMPSFIIVARRWVSNRLFFKLLPRNNIKTIMNVNANFRLFDHSLFTIRYLSLHLSFFNFFFSFRTLVTRIPTAKITQLVSLDLHSRDIDACVLLDSRENVVK